MPFEMNSTIGVGYGNTAGAWWPLLMIVTAILVIGVLALVFGSFARYRRFRGFLGFMGKALGYFGNGLMALSIFGAGYAGVFILGMSVEAGTIQLDQILIWTGIAIGGFFGIAGLGYAFDRFLWKRVSKFNQKYKKEKKT